MTNLYLLASQFVKSLSVKRKKCCTHLLAKFSYSCRKTQIVNGKGTQKKKKEKNKILESWNSWSHSAAVWCHEIKSLFKTTEASHLILLHQMASNSLEINFIFFFLSFSSKWQLAELHPFLCLTLSLDLLERDVDKNSNFSSLMNKSNCSTTRVQGDIDFTKSCKIILFFFDPRNTHITCIWWKPGCYFFDEIYNRIHMWNFTITCPVEFKEIHQNTLIIKMTFHMNFTLSMRNNGSSKMAILERKKKSKCCILEKIHKEVLTWLGMMKVLKVLWASLVSQLLAM